jgi:hypothetical protein
MTRNFEALSGQVCIDAYYIMRLGWRRVFVYPVNFDDIVMPLGTRVAGKL